MYYIPIGWTDEIKINKNIVKKYNIIFHIFIIYIFYIILNCMRLINLREMWKKFENIKTYHNIDIDNLHLNIK